MKKQLLLATSIFATGILCAQVANKAATKKAEFLLIWQILQLKKML
jgi:hypothetical protein